MFRKTLLALIAVVALSFAGATAAGAQQYSSSTVGSQSSVPEDVFEEDVVRGDPEAQSGQGAQSASAVKAGGPLARTGLDTGTLGSIALALFAAGTVLVAASRRPTRRA